MTSWKTTTGGITAIVAAIAGAINLMVDNDPATNPDWSVVMPIIIGAFAILFARDNDKTSEDVGADKK